METGTTITTGTPEIRTLEALQTKTTSSQLGQDDFLKILVAQMSSQDPMEPTSNTDFIAQMVQFSLLEEIQSMGSSYMTSQAYSLIGKTVYIDNETELVCGKVDGVFKKDGIDCLIIGDETFELSSVTCVLDEDSSEVFEQDILQSANLIGKTVTATVLDEQGEPVTITGQVEKILIQDSAVFAVVNGENIPLSGILEIAATTI